jgi:putative transposase
MPRPARLVLPGLPHHVTQRGNGRDRTFFGADDYRLYLGLLRGACRKTRTAVWAWCLMPNHVHLILAPPGEDGLRATLAPLHTRYALEINRREGRCGHLWQGRFASFPMDDAHLYACLRYVELNPLRARLAERPEDWPWSSARAHLGLAGDGLTDLAATRGRVEDWRAFLDEGLDEDDREAIRTAERSGRLRLKSRPRR